MYSTSIQKFFNLFTIFFFPGFLLLTGCATTEDMGRMQWDINELKSEIKDLREKAPTPVQREKLDKQLLELQNSQDLTAKTVSDLMIQFQSLTTEFRILTGRFEESRYYAEKSSAEMKGEREKLMAQLKDMELAIDDLKKKIEAVDKAASPSAKEEEKPAEDKKAAEETKKDQEPGKKDSTKPEDKKEAQQAEKKEPEKTEGKKEAPKTDVKDVYMAGYQAYRDGKTAEAREKFNSVLKDYPANEYSDNARFWTAESYYKDKQYEDAILAYEELIKSNPKSDKVPGALLKQGLSFYALKDETTGRIVLEKLIEQFPNSEQALTAKKKLGKSAPQKKK